MTTAPLGYISTSTQTWEKPHKIVFETFEPIGLTIKILGIDVADMSRASSAMNECWNISSTSITLSKGEHNLEFICQNQVPLPFLTAEELSILLSVVLLSSLKNRNEHTRVEVRISTKLKYTKTSHNITELNILNAKDRYIQELAKDYNFRLPDTEKTKSKKKNKKRK